MDRIGDFPRNPKEDMMYQCVIKKHRKPSKIIDAVLSISALILFAGAIALTIVE